MPVLAGGWEDTNSFGFTHYGNSAINHKFNGSCAKSLVLVLKNLMAESCQLINCADAFNPEVWGVEHP